MNKKEYNEQMKKLSNMEMNTTEQINERETKIINLIDQYERELTEHHDRIMEEIGIKIQELRATVPKEEIYIGKVKKE